PWDGAVPAAPGFWAKARLMVATWMRTPVKRTIVSTNNSRVQVRPTPAIGLRRSSYHPVQFAQVVVVQLLRPIIGSAILQASFPIALEALQDAVDRRVMDLQDCLRLRDGAPIEHIDNDQIP